MTNGKPRVFLSGPVSKKSDPWPAFKAAEKAWRAKGFRVLNPARYGPMDWADAMRRSLRMLVKADTVAVLPGWQDSRGSGVEIRVAFELGLPVVDATTGEAFPQPPHLEMF